MARGLPREIDVKYREAILNGPIISTFLYLGLPLLLVRIVQDVYGIVDAFWLSRYSQYAMAVPRQVWPSYTLFTSFIMSFTSANLALLSQYVGAKMYDMVNDVVRRMLFVIFVGGGVSGFLFSLVSQYLFRYLVGVPLEILADVIGYARVMAIDAVFLGINLSLATLVQSLGDTRIAAISQVVGAIANVFLDPIFIYGVYIVPTMGAVGAAIATVLSKVVSMGVLITAIVRRYRWIRIGVTHRLDRYYIATTLRIAIPLLVMNISNSIAFNLQNRLVNTFGIIATTAFSVGFILFELANTSLWGLTEGIAIMVGQNLGAGNIERSRSIARKTSLFIFVSVAISSVAMYLARDYIASVFITGQNVEKEVVDGIYLEYNRFVSATLWTLAFFGLTFSAMSIGRGSGHTLMPTIINMVRLWGIRIGLGYALALGLNLNTMGIYIAFALSNIIGGAMSILWIYNGSWAKSIIKKPVPKPEPTHTYGQIKSTK